MNKNVPIRFFVITFLWTWLFFAPLALMKMGVIPHYTFLLKAALPLIMLAAFGPAIGACFSIYTISGKDAIKKYIKSFLSLNFGWKAWAVIFLVFGSLQIISWVTPEFFGENRLPALIPISMFFPYFLLMAFLGGGQEEIGWRGYMQPILEKRFGFIIGALFVGIIWSIWHLPLWFMLGTSQSFMPFGAFVLLTIGYSYIFSWIVDLSEDKLLSGIIAHGTANSMMVLFPTLIMEIDKLQVRFWIYCILVFMVGITIGIWRSIKSRKTEL